MKPETLKRCIEEAKRFIKLAQSVPIGHYNANEKVVLHIDYGKESGATRRASMDLTRALADLRQGR